MIGQNSARLRRARLAEAMASGVYVEAQDQAGNTVGQAVFTAWQGRPLPQVGEMLVCPLNSLEHGRRKIAGEVTERRFEIQCDEAGNPEIWVSMIILVEEATAAAVCDRSRIPYR